MVAAEIYGKRILYGVLNWGLGHATRSSVLIHQLLLQNNEVTLVSSGQALAFLRQQFPQLPYHEMPANEIVYPAHRHLWIKLLMQKKKVFGNIALEKETADRLCIRLDPDLLISDNCYGFYQHRIPSVLLTHQVNIQSPFLEKAAQKRVHQLLQEFYMLWIPDLAGDENLSGKLSRPVLPGRRFACIGPLSALLPAQNADMEYEYCAIISGPEKQRTLFEREVLDFLTQQQKPAVLIRGTNIPRKSQEIPSWIRITDVCPTQELRALLGKSRTVIGRTGYTTIMDMYSLQKPCMLLPTPGQTEQEYLFTKHFGRLPRSLQAVSARLISPCKG